MDAMVPIGDVGALVLAGGAGTRLGRDKAALPAPGGTFLTRIVATLGEVVGEIVVVGPATGRLPEPGPAPPGVALRVVRDEVEGRGPLEGVRAGLASMQAGTVYVTAADAPRLSRALVVRVVEALGAAPGATIAVARTGAHVHPLAMAVRREPALEAATRLCARGGAGPVALLDALPHVRVPADDLAEALRDVDTPEDLVAMDALLRDEARPAPPRRALAAPRASAAPSARVASGPSPAPGPPAMTTPAHDDPAPESFALDDAERGDVRGLKIAFWLGVVAGVVHGAPKYGVFSMYTVALAGLMIITFVGLYAAYVALRPARPAR